MALEIIYYLSLDLGALLKTRVRINNKKKVIFNLLRINKNMTSNGTALISFTSLGNGPIPQVVVAPNNASETTPIDGDGNVPPIRVPNCGMVLILCATHPFLF